MNGFLKFTLWTFGIFIGLGVIGNIGNDANQSTTESTQSISTSSDKTESNKPKEKEKPVVLSKEGVSSDVKISIIEVKSSKQVGDNQFSTTKASGVFKVIKVTIENNQKDAITIDGNSFKLIDDQGREFNYSSEAQLALISSVNEKYESFFLEQLNPGLSKTGYLVFDVPKDAKGFTMEARGGMMGDPIKLKVD